MRRIGALCLAVLCAACMSACSSRILEQAEAPRAVSTESAAAAPGTPAAQTEEPAPATAASVMTEVPASAATVDTASAARNPQTSEDLKKMAQCVLAGGFAVTSSDSTQVDLSLLNSILYQIYTFRMAQKCPPTAEELAYSQNDQNLVDPNDRDLVPVLQNAVDSAVDTSPSGDMWVSATDVYALYCSIVDCSLSESEFIAQTNITSPGEYISFEARNGGYVFPPHESFYTAIYYADRVPFPHQGNDTYRFRLVCYTSSGWHDMCEITFTPAPDSPFGCRVVRSENQTAAYGDELLEMARDFSVHPDGFVFPDSDTRLLTTADLDKLTRDLGLEEYTTQYALAFARNELFARHGNIFDTPAYREYFSQFDWYNPSHKVDTPELNATERANLDTIIAWEEEAKQY